MERGLGNPTDLVKLVKLVKPIRPIKSSCRSTLFALVLVALTAVLAGCLGTKYAWSSAPIATSEVRIVPQEVYRRKDRLFVRVTLTNLSSSTLTVDRDAMTLQLDTGRILGRSVGMTSLHKPYSLPPGAAHSIYVDFKDDDIHEDRGSANVIWSGAVFDGGREVQIPPTPLRARD